MNIPRNIFGGQVNYLKLQYGLKYFDSDGNKYTLTPSDAREIQFNIGSGDVKMVSIYNNISTNLIHSSPLSFMKL
ncbi:MAG: hypothetical protein ACJASF_000206 [Vicingaceae bacterium]|jgi:hypothetical protein